MTSSSTSQLYGAFHVKSTHFWIKMCIIDSDFDEIWHGSRTQWETLKTKISDFFSTDFQDVGHSFLTKTTRFTTTNQRLNCCISAHIPPKIKTKIPKESYLKALYGHIMQKLPIQQTKIMWASVSYEPWPRSLCTSPNYKQFCTYNALIVLNNC